MIISMSLLIILNEYHIFGWQSHISMFLHGMLNNTCTCFAIIVLGFEFDSKIVPFGAKLLVENFAVFTTVGLLSLVDLENKIAFRNYFVLTLVIGLVSLAILYRFKFRGE